MELLHGDKFMTKYLLTLNSQINRLRQLLSNVKSGSTELEELRRELDEIHGREMEGLRTYFERKCADMEKQYCLLR